MYELIVGIFNKLFQILNTKNYEYSKMAQSLPAHCKGGHFIHSKSHL